MATKKEKDNEEKEVTQKTVRSSSKPLSTKTNGMSEKRIQTAEGWRRSMLRSRKGQKKESS
jgi:hypothetical protein